jgi:hypothetical protein
VVVSSVFQFDRAVAEAICPSRGTPSRSAAPRKSKHSVICVTDGGRVPIYSYTKEKNGVTVRVVMIWHWLEYDSVAFAVLVASISIVTLLVLGI